MARKMGAQLHRPMDKILGKDLRVSGCAICKRYIFSNQKFIWTRQIGFVHTEDCLERVT